MADIIINVEAEVSLSFTTPGGEFDVELALDHPHAAKGYMLELTPLVGAFPRTGGRHSLNKIEAIKWVRTLTGRGLKESKDLVDKVTLTTPPDRGDDFNPVLGEPWEPPYEPHPDSPFRYTDDS